MVAAVKASVLAEKVDVAPPSALDQLGSVMMNATHNAAAPASASPGASDIGSSTDSLPPPPEVGPPRAPPPPVDVGDDDDIGPPPPFAAPTPVSLDPAFPPLPALPAPQPPSPSV